MIFPVDFWPLLQKYAKQRNLDPYLVAALVAQESNFDPEVRSHANAYGLMQILPSTGRQYARKLGVRPFSTRRLTEAEVNVRLGTQIFADSIRKFGGVHFALAAYNAGDSRVARWQREKPGLPQDEFIDDIPFPETQNYVKRILGTAEDYRYLYSSALLKQSGRRFLFPSCASVLMTRIRSARRVSSFADSVFAEMTRLAKLHNAVNLSQGFPDFEAPQAIKDAACTAIQAEQNQYAPPYGTHALRDAIAADFTRRYGVPADADEQVTVCCGSTEAMMAVMLSCIDPGDEVIVFEPFYENYGPDAILAGAEPKYVRLREPDWRFDPDELTRAFNNRTRAIVINSPNNPTGKVFTRDELQVIAELCQRWDVLAISDEIYERIVFNGHSHVPMASLPGMADRTVTTGGLSKTYSVTGWRIGWAISPPALTRRDPEDPRLSYRGRAHAVSRRRRGGALDARHVLYAAGCRLPVEAQLDGRYPAAARVREFQARWRLLRDGRRQPVRVRIGFGVCALPGQRSGRGHRSRQQLLC